MYKISVPILINNIDRLDLEKIVVRLKEISAERVFLALGSYTTDSKEFEELMIKYEEYVKYFKKHGFEVGEWSWTFQIINDEKYIHITSPCGVVCKNQICPSDENFIKFASEYVKRIAKTGVDLIMYDDDYRYSFLEGGMGCLCENHLNYMREVLDENFELDDIKDKLITGGGNKYRSAWLKANRHYLLNFAKKMREAVNEVNSKVRLGFCSCMGEWDIDGADSIEISKVLAGDTKPFLRLIGAPYWGVNKLWGNRLQDVIELERMERAWCDGEKIEIFSEGDVYPRPRYHVPSSYLEGFDTALRADGNMDGILKYVFDYCAREGYETGYVDSHIENKEFYKDIDEFFGNKECVGVRVFESMKKFENMEVPKEADTPTKLADIFFSPAARMLAANSIPSVYRGMGFATVAFGENAKYIPEENFKNGLILDLRAAEILTEKGIDVGITKIYGEVSATEEYFVKEDDFANLSYNTTIYNISVNEKAEIQSWFLNKNVTLGGVEMDKNSEFVGSYFYENANGERFLVFAFNAYYCNDSLYRQYARARQITDNIKRLCGKNLPATISVSPDLYTITKKNDNSLSIGLWNFFPDSVRKPQITLDREYKKIRCSNCNAKIDGREITVSPINAFSFAAIEVFD